GQGLGPDGDHALLQRQRNRAEVPPELLLGPHHPEDHRGESGDRGGDSRAADPDLHGPALRTEERRGVLRVQNPLDGEDRLHLLRVLVLACALQHLHQPPVPELPERSAGKALLFLPVRVGRAAQPREQQAHRRPHPLLERGSGRRSVHADADDTVAVHDGEQLHGPVVRRGDPGAPSAGHGPPQRRTALQVHRPVRPADRLPARDDLHRQDQRQHGGHRDLFRGSAGQRHRDLLEGKDGEGHLLRDAHRRELRGEGPGAPDRHAAQEGADRLPGRQAQARLHPQKRDVPLLRHLRIHSVGDVRGGRERGLHAQQPVLSVRRVSLQVRSFQALHDRRRLRGDERAGGGPAGGDVAGPEKQKEAQRPLVPGVREPERTEQRQLPGPHPPFQKPFSQPEQQQHGGRGLREVLLDLQTRQQRRQPGLQSGHFAVRGLLPRGGGQEEHRDGPRHAPKDRAGQGKALPSRAQHEDRTALRRVHRGHSGELQAEVRGLGTRRHHREQNGVLRHSRKHNRLGAAPRGPLEELRAPLQVQLRREGLHQETADRHVQNEDQEERPAED
ncbi:hypothetical protein HWI79_3375, partial [Cryptosporidium felis]